MASKGLWKKELRAARWKLAAGLPILLITAILTPLIFDYTVRIMDNSAVPEFAKAQAVLLKDFRYFVWSQWFGKNLIQMGSLLAVIFGAGLVSTEITRKTIQFLLSKPIRREEIFTVKYVVNLVNIFLITAVSSAALYASLLTVNRNYPGLQIFQQTVVVAAGLSVVYSLTVFYSTVFEKNMKSVSASIFTVFLLQISSWLPFSKKFSIFYHMSGPGIYSGHGFPYITLVVLAAISAALYYLGKTRFVSRDF